MWRNVVIIIINHGELQGFLHVTLHDYIFMFCFSDGLVQAATGGGNDTIPAETEDLLEGFLMRTRCLLYN